MANAIGRKLGVGAVAECKRIAAATLALGLAIILTLSAITFAIRSLIFRMYGANESAEVLRYAEQLWPWMCVDLAVDNSFALLTSLNRGLGLQRRSAACIVCVLWPLGVPLILFGADSVTRIWQLMPIIYATLDVLQIGCFACSSWAKLAETLQLEASLAGASVTSSSSSSSAPSACSPSSSSSSCTPGTQMMSMRNVGASGSSERSGG